MAEIDLSAFSNVVPLGSGGLGDVYRAVRRSTGGEVAIKVLRDWSDSDVAWQRTQRELRALVHLKGHGNVVNIEEVLETDGAMAIVMEYAPGGAVSDLLRERGPLGFAEVLLIATHTAAALSASHDRGIIHRDIKPHNLLIDSFGQVKVCDFGIAALTRSDEVSNRTSALSLRYASPEELRGDPDIGPAADVYSLAATVHQLLTGRYLPIPDGTPESAPLLGWTAPHEIPAHVAEAFRSLVTRAADRTASERPTATALHDQLDILSGQLGPLRSRALPLATPELDDATQVRSVSITGPTDPEPPAAPTAPPPEPSAESHTVILGRPATPPATHAEQPAAAADAPVVEPSVVSPDRPVRRTFLAIVAIVLAAAGAAALYIAGIFGGDAEVDHEADCFGDECIVVTEYAPTDGGIVIDYVTSSAGDSIELRWRTDRAIDDGSAPAATWSAPAAGVGRQIVEASIPDDVGWLCLVTVERGVTTCVPALADGWVNDRAVELDWVAALNEPADEEPLDYRTCPSDDECIVMMGHIVDANRPSVVKFAFQSDETDVEVYWLFSNDVDENRELLPETDLNDIFGRTPQSTFTDVEAGTLERQSTTGTPSSATGICLLLPESGVYDCVPILGDASDSVVTWDTDDPDDLARFESITGEPAS